MAKSRRIYFTKMTENAIIKYNLETDYQKKSKIYSEEIATPLNKLVENIINRFKFPYFKECSEDLQAEVISFLIMNMHKYDPNKGKAFSYFSIVAKNYLILGNNDRYKMKKLNERIDLPENEYEHEIIDEVHYKKITDDTTEFVDLMIKYWDANIDKIFIKKQDIMIADAILTLFKRADSIENHNKKALYLMIREMTGLRTQYITTVVNKMKEHNKLLKEQFSMTGYFNPDDCVIQNNDFF